MYRRGGTKSSLRDSSSRKSVLRDGLYGGEDRMSMDVNIARRGRSIISPMLAALPACTCMVCFLSALVNNEAGIHCLMLILFKMRVFFGRSVKIK